jgi:hypothetical protein
LEEAFCQTTKKILSVYHSVPGFLESHIKEYAAEKGIAPETLDANEIRSGFYADKFRLCLPKTLSCLKILHLRNQAASLWLMRAIMLSLSHALLGACRTRLALQAEILALRHQINILRRSVPTRPRLNAPDRFLWVWLSRLWPDWRSALVIVKPETVIAGHRKGFRLFWT